MRLQVFNCVNCVCRAREAFQLSTQSQSIVIAPRRGRRAGGQNAVCRNCARRHGPDGHHDRRDPRASATVLSRRDRDGHRDPCAGPFRNWSAVSLGAVAGDLWHVELQDFLWRGCLQCLASQGKTAQCRRRRRRKVPAQKYACRHFEIAVGYRANRDRCYECRPDNHTRPSTKFRPYQAHDDPDGDVDHVDRIGPQPERNERSPLQYAHVCLSSIHKSCEGNDQEILWQPPVQDSANGRSRGQLNG